MTDPLVSIIIPAFNAAEWVGATIRSAQAQTHRAIEIIVVDDGSTDATSEIISELARTDDRIRLIVQTNRGLAKTRNVGLDAATGAFVAPLDADDIWSPQKIELQLAALMAAPAGTALAYNWYRRIDAADRVLPPSPYPRVEGRVFLRHLEWNFISNGSTPLVRTEVARTVRYNPVLRECEDYLFQLQVARDHGFVCVPRFLTGYRKLPRSMSTASERMLRSHLQMFGIVAENAPQAAKPIIVRRCAEIRLTLAGLLARKHDPRFVSPLAAAIAGDPSTLGRVIVGKFSRHDPVMGDHADERPFAEHDPVIPDGAWATRRSAILLERLEHLDSMTD